MASNWNRDPGIGFGSSTADYDLMRKIAKAKENKDLSLMEQKRKYSDERKRFDNQNAFVNSGLFIQGLKNG